ncbi:MAG: hypothetical protein ACI9K2_005116 [Myxococcota bacterium]|jgi:hypothetical protein
MYQPAATTQPGSINFAEVCLTSLTRSGTPNHPFWVPAVRDYVPLGKLEVGTVLHVQGGGEAILVSKAWRQGEFEVFDFEVEGLHNFYVRGEGSDGAGVLVHNSTGKARSTRADELSGVLDPRAQRSRTSAALDTDQGVVIGGGGRDLNPAQRATAKPGETLAKSPGDHAEITVLRQADATGAKPSSIGASRKFCDSCKAEIESRGGTLTSDRTADFD